MLMLIKFYLQLLAKKGNNIRSSNKNLLDFNVHLKVNLSKVLYILNFNFCCKVFYFNSKKHRKN